MSAEMLTQIVDYNHLDGSVHRQRFQALVWFLLSEPA